MCNWWILKKGSAQKPYPLSQHEDQKDMSPLEENNLENMQGGLLVGAHVSYYSLSEAITYSTSVVARRETSNSHCVSSHF
jgi:hypothetical protein